MKILVTGHKGFIGGHFFRQLSTRHQVVGFEWGEDFPGYDFDWILHVGAITSTTETDVERVFRQNYDFTVDLLENCHRLGVNVQFSSTAALYGQTRNFTESSALDPRTPYAWSKYMVERHIRSRSWRNIIQCFRYFNVYGSGEDHKGSQASPQHRFRQQYQQQGHVSVFRGSEHYLRDFVSVEQVVSTQMKFLSIPESGVWNLGSGQARSFLDVARDITHDIRFIDMPDQLKHSYQSYTCADLSHVNDTLARHDYFL